MNHRMLWAPTVAALTLAACQSAPTEPGPVDDNFGVDACGASELQDMVGAPKTILATMKFAVPLRVIEPGTAVTADFSPNRLNFEIGADGMITRIACY